VRIVTTSGVNALHPISSCCQDVDDKLLVFWLPSLHFSMRINSELDIVLDIPHLSILVVYGYGTESQGFKDNLDVGLGAACNAYTQVRES